MANERFLVLLVILANCGTCISRLQLRSIPKSWPNNPARSEKGRQALEPTPQRRKKSTESDLPFDQFSAANSQQDLTMENDLKRGNNFELLSSGKPFQAKPSSRQDWSFWPENHPQTDSDESNSMPKRSRSNGHQIPFLNVLPQTEKSQTVVTREDDGQLCQAPVLDTNVDDNERRQLGHRKKTPKGRPQKWTKKRKNQRVKANHFQTSNKVCSTGTCQQQSHRRLFREMDCELFFPPYKKEIESRPFLDNREKQYICHCIRGISLSFTSSCQRNVISHPQDMLTKAFKFVLNWVNARLEFPIILNSLYHGNDCPEVVMSLCICNHFSMIEVLQRYLGYLKSSSCNFTRVVFETHSGHNNCNSTVQLCLENTTPILSDTTPRHD